MCVSFPIMCVSIECCCCCVSDVHELRESFIFGMGDRELKKYVCFKVFSELTGVSDKIIVRNTSFFVEYNTMIQLYNNNDIC